MICANCGVRAAAVYLRRSVAGSGGNASSGDLALCEECARARGIVAGKGRLDIRVDELLAGAPMGDVPQAVPARCPSCGLDLDELRRGGLLGCPSCADTFYPEIERQLSRRAPSPSAAPAAPVPRPRRAALSRPATAHDRLAYARRLELALAEEDYEEAVRIRDELALDSTPGGAVYAPPADLPFPFGYPAFFLGAGPDDDVVLSCRARVSRNFPSIPFPGSAPGGPAPSREIALALVAAMGDWDVRAMETLGRAGRRSLSERGLVPRAYASDPAAPVAASRSEPLYALFDETDHVRILARLPGADPALALELAEGAASRLAALPGSAGFASDPRFGWTCARLADCGGGFALSATLHLPALVMTGLHERYFRRALADNLSVRGLYAEGEPSAGSVFEISAPRSAEGGAAVAAFARSLASAAQAERRAREGLAARERARLVDAAGRAFGVARHCRMASAGESAALLSSLRLASLLGELRGADWRMLGRLLEETGQGSLAVAGQGNSPPAAHAAPVRAVGEESEASEARAALLHRAVMGAELAVEGGARCSRD